MSTSGYQINGIAAMPPTGSIIAYYGTSDPDGWVITTSTSGTSYTSGINNNGSEPETRPINMGVNWIMKL